VRWLGTKAEELGVEIYPGFAASEVQDILTFLRSHCLSYFAEYVIFSIHEAQVSQYRVTAGLICEQPCCGGSYK